MRNTRIDILKSISMISVVGLHILGIGGILNNTSVLDSSYFFVWGLNILFYSFVNCFGIVTGYFYIKYEPKNYKIVQLWSKVVFYSIVMTFLIKLIMKNGNVITTVSSFFPVITNQYWYFSAYIVLFCLIPYLNKLINSLTFQEQRRFLIIILFIFSFFGSLQIGDGFAIMNGYSPIWLIVLYSLGAIIRNNELKFRMDTKKILILIISILFFNVILKFLVDFLTLKYFGESFGGSFFIKYNSPTIIPLSILTFLLCLIQKKNMKFKSSFNFLSNHSFSVYLIHACPSVLNSIFLNEFKFFSLMNPIVECFAIIILSSTIFFICIMIDYLIELILFKKIFKLMSRRFGT